MIFWMIICQIMRLIRWLDVFEDVIQVGSEYRNLWIQLDILGLKKMTSMRIRWKSEFLDSGMA